MNWDEYLKALSVMRTPPVMGLSADYDSLVNALAGLPSNLAGSLMDASYIMTMQPHEMADIAMGKPNQRPGLREFPMSSDWIGEMLGADVDSLEFILSSMLMPDGTDVAIPAAKLAMGSGGLDNLIDPSMLDSVGAIFAGLRSLDNIGDAPVMTSHGVKTGPQLASDHKRAVELDKQGLDTWNETGWFKGADGKWRYEIDDSRAVIEKSHPASYLPEKYGIDWGDNTVDVATREAQIADQNEAISETLAWGLQDGTLGRYLLHDALYNAYPELKETAHTFRKMEGPFGASYIPQENRISLALGNLMHPDRSVSSTLHEAQHKIQDIEGFALGSSPRDSAREMGRIHYNLKEYSGFLDRIVKDANDDAASLIKAADSGDKTAATKVNDAVDSWLGRLGGWKSKENPYGLESRQQAVSEAILSENPMYNKISDQVDKYRKLSIKDGFGIYKAHGGEVEARNVQNRLDFTPEQKRLLDPTKTQDTPNKYQIIKFDDSGVKSESPLKRNGEEIAQALPMDEASRMARAQEMGFDTTGYHGTGADIDEFQGITWISESPKLANEYAFMRGAKGGDANVMPLVAKQGNSFNADRMPKRLTVDQFFSRVIDSANDNGKKFTDAEWDRMDELRNILKRGADKSYGGNYDRHDFWFQSEDAFGPESKGVIEELMDISGFDSIKMMEGGEQTIGIIKPKNIRSKNANFDPAKADSANLNAMLTDALMAQAAGAV